MEFICIQMGKDMTGNGRMISQKDMESRHGRMEQNLRVITKQERRLAKAPFYGVMDQLILATLSIMTSQGQAYIPGLMEEDMKENG